MRFQETQAPSNESKGRERERERREQKLVSAVELWPWSCGYMRLERNRASMSKSVLTRWEYQAKSLNRGVSIL